MLTNTKTQLQWFAARDERFDWLNLADWEPREAEVILHGIGIEPEATLTRCDGQATTATRSLKVTASPARSKPTFNKWPTHSTGWE
jgi:hypothetical protein